MGSTGRARYRTRQRELVAECLANNVGRYLTVDDVCSSIAAAGGSVGRTTTYRALEAMVEDGRALKATAPGGEASYRAADEAAAGQLVCLRCGHVASLDCGTAAEFTEHVLDHHKFKAEPARTVFYGVCSMCMETEHGE